MIMAYSLTLSGLTVVAGDEVIGPRIWDASLEAA